MDKPSSLPKQKSNTLGRLAALGPKEPWQTPLLLPDGWDDFTQVIADFSFSPRQRKVVVRGRLHREIDLRFNNRIPRIVGYLTDGLGKIGFVKIGEVRDVQNAIEEFPDDVILYGSHSYLESTLWLNDIEVLDPSWLGRMRPRYRGIPRVISSDTTRERILQHLPGAFDQCSRWLQQQLNLPETQILDIANCGHTSSLSSLLYKCHLPDSLAEGTAAQKSLERIAAFGVAREVILRRNPEAPTPNTFALADWRQFAADLPFTLNSEQVQAIEDITSRIRAGQPLRHCLAGDVGTGKTAVYAITARAVLAGGGRVAIMLPNEPLAKQIYADFRAWWPDIEILLATSASNCGKDLSHHRILIGTQALLFKHTGDIDLLIADEQQKFSRAQREQLTKSNSHLLEVSATCIPRSHALVKYGIQSMSKLKTGNVEKRITTRIWSRDDRRELMNTVFETVAAGRRVFVIYPVRDLTDEAASEKLQAERLPAAEQAFETWNRHFPGRARLAHGGLTESENEAALHDLKNGLADVLVTTSLVEVGINVPDTGQILVIHAERFGLSTLHQLRGRLARNGGDGRFDLLLQPPVSEDVMHRLDILVRTNDGFEVANHDMSIRGFGDLGRNSTKQSGSDDTFLFGRPLSPQVLEEVLSATLS